MKFKIKVTLSQFALALATLSFLSGCASSSNTASNTNTIAADRRTADAVLADEAIEQRVRNRLSEEVLGSYHINVVSYNRHVLLTGEVPAEREKEIAEKAAAKVERVQSVTNELGVLGNSTYLQRSSDSYINTKARAALVDASDLSVRAFRVVTERGVVYLLGRVTKREADRAAEVVRRVDGVQQVVRVLEILSESEYQKLLPQASAK